MTRQMGIWDSLMTTMQKLSILIWAPVIVGSGISFFSNNPTIKFLGACIWLVGGLAQLIVGTVLIIRYYKEKKPPG